MTVEQASTDQGLSLVVGGIWEREDGSVLRNALEALPDGPIPLEVTLAGLDSLPPGAVQILLAYIRYARGMRRPVHIHLGTKHVEAAGFWGLTGGGWEAYFHVG